MSDIVERMKTYASRFEKIGKETHGDVIRRWAEEVESIRSAATQARDAGLADAYNDGICDAMERLDRADNTLWQRRDLLIDYVRGLLMPHGAPFRKSTPAREGE